MYGHVCTYAAQASVHWESQPVLQQHDGDHELELKASAHRTEMP